MVISRTPKLHQPPESEGDPEAEMCLPPPSPKSPEDKPGTPPPARRHHPCFKAGIVMIYMLCGWAGVDLCLSRLQKSNDMSASSSAADIRAANLAIAAQHAIPTTAEGYRDRYLKCDVELGFYEGAWVPANATRLGGLYKLPESHYFSPRLLEREAVEGADAVEGAASAEGEGMNATTWGWQPREEACTLRDFESGRFCRLLRGRMNVSRVLVVGDAVSFAWALSLVGMLGGPLNQDQHNWTATRVCEGSLGEGDTGALSVQYLRNDALYTSEYVLEGIAEEPGEGEPEGEAKEGSADAWSGVDFQRSRPWTPYLQDTKPELLMLNLGTGIRNYDAYTRQIDRLLTYLKAELKPTTNVVFRTSSPGHQECWNFTSPTVDLSFNRDYSGEYHDVLKWHLVGDCNAYAAAQFAGQLQTQATILHGDKLTRFRPDGHVMGDGRDCLQYVLPGVPDWWTRVLYNIMEAKFPAQEELEAAPPEAPVEGQVADKDPRR